MRRLILSASFLAMLFIVPFVAGMELKQVMYGGALLWRIGNDEELKEVLPLKDLKMAWLNGSQVTDAGLRKLSGSSGKLARLNLYHTRVTDAGLKDLRAFKNLEDLYLGFTQVTDAGLKHLAPDLKTLDLTGTGVTDAGLKDLATMTRLESLFLNATNVTEAGLTDLRSKLPRCRIFPFLILN